MRLDTKVSVTVIFDNGFISLTLDALSQKHKVQMNKMPMKPCRGSNDSFSVRSDISG